MFKIGLALIIAFCLTVKAWADQPPPDTRMMRESGGQVDGVRWGSEPYEPSTPKPDYQHKLERSSNRDPDTWRTNRTNRRDPSENSPNK
ncbi:MAG: hypothetical protein LBM64_09995 [Deltaproteobacteria bacterium]|jgi:hypothetical protein|nr:hypothetical protein [Deltaproteobacteria bacterium]